MSDNFDEAKRKRDKLFADRDEIRKRDKLFSDRAIRQRRLSLNSPFFKVDQFRAIAAGDRTMARGNVGFGVCMVQAALSIGPNSARLVGDGIFGLRTQEAVRHFQRMNRIETTGEVDSKTLSALDYHASKLAQFRL